MNSLTLTGIKKADRYYRQWYNKTPIEYSKVLSDYLQTPVIFKLENMQVSGSYKLRCAHYHFSTLANAQLNQGLALASDEYFSLAYAYICFMHNIECHIYAPKSLNPDFQEKIFGYGAKIHFLTNKTPQTLKKAAKKLSEKEGYHFIDTDEEPSYKVCGGALVKEILEDVPQMATLIMPDHEVGLIEGARFYLLSLDGGYKVISSSLKGQSAKTKEDSHINVSEKDINNAMQWLFKHHQIFVEAKGITPLAASLKKSFPKFDGPIVIVLSDRFVCSKVIKNLL